MSPIKVRPARLLRLLLPLLLLWLTVPVDRAWSSTGAAEGNLVAQIKRIKESVVAVGTYYFKDSVQLKYRGTGFVVGDGTLIVTNAHVISQIETEKRLGQLRILHRGFSPQGEPAKVVQVDETHDLALLKVEGSPLPALQLGDSSTVQEGESIAFTGYPIGPVLGLNPTTHTGIISAIAPIVVPSPKARAIKKELVEFFRQPFDIFQVDATAYPGNSGSPVFRVSTGEVIGIINMVFVKEKKENLLKDPSGITYAVPSNFARSLLEGYQQGRGP
jgi:serine protease Do